MNIREVAEELRRAEESIVFWKNSSTIRQKKLLEKDKEIERLNNIIDKAIEYIERAEVSSIGTPYSFTKRGKDLLNILKGDDR